LEGVASVAKFEEWNSRSSCRSVWPRSPCRKELIDCAEVWGVGETYFLVDVDDYVVPASGHDYESRGYYSRRETLRETERVAVCMKELLVCASLKLDVNSGQLM
jgi:hypothetical protein